jgi:hypothetical protein
MKTDTSMNIMLVLFCIILIAFVFFNCRMNEALGKEQADLEIRTQVNNR